ncbi:acyl carrier protein [Roseibaca sp. Y0-43]|uniref:acyl carrier protein n=1 Tax=Roseibaca sp. Y0-43 TaxID=2816854 RepID=UPI001D0C34CF|nr:phosphopantetheine-binding protein [Roseibaca sp. Y0-43]
MGLDFMLDENPIAQRVREIIAEQAMVDVSELRDDMTLADLDLDSLGLVECIFGIEEAFDVSIPFNANNPDESGFDISSVGAIIRQVEGLIAKQAA